MLITAHLYGGPRDGAHVPTGKRVKTLILPEATYHRSPTWSAHFGRPTFVVAGHRGPCPAETVKA